MDATWSNAASLSVVTPGTVTDPALVRDSGNAYIVALLRKALRRPGLRRSHDRRVRDDPCQRRDGADQLLDLLRRELLRLESSGDS